MLENISVNYPCPHVASFGVHLNTHKRNSGFSLSCSVQIFIMNCLTELGCNHI